MRLADERDAGFGAALFHATLVAALVEWVARRRGDASPATVALGGGCFLNAVLARGLRAALAPRGIALLEAAGAPQRRRPRARPGLGRPPRSKES